MSLRKRRLLASGVDVVFLFWLQGCAQESSEPTDPLSGGNHSERDCFRVHAVRGDVFRPLVHPFLLVRRCMDAL